MSWYDSQTKLDSFLNLSNPSPEPQESRVETAETRAESEVWRCEVCGEPSGPFTFQRLRLHPGAVKLYRKNFEWSARADMDHVYNRCRKGLMENLKFLKRLYDDLHYYMYYRKRVGGGRFEIIGVGKAYDDTLYIYGVGRFPQEFKGFRVGYVEIEDVEALERFHSHLEPVPEDVIEEALREPEAEEKQVRLSEFEE